MFQQNNWIHFSSRHHIHHHCVAQCTYSKAAIAFQLDFKFHLDLDHMETSIEFRPLCRIPMLSSFCLPGYKQPLAQLRQRSDGSIKNQFNRKPTQTAPNNITSMIRTLTKTYFSIFSSPPSWAEASAEQETDHIYFNDFCLNHFNKSHLMNELQLYEKKLLH